jgi:hypothetical protein
MSNERPLAGQGAGLHNGLRDRLLRPLPLRYRERFRSDIHWRSALLAVSAGGSLATLACAVIGKEALALRLFIANVVVLWGLLSHAASREK